MASNITIASLSNLRLPQSFNQFSGAPAIDVKPIDPSETFTARTTALPAAGTYCTKMAPLASDVTNGVFVFLWDDAWKHIQLFPMMQHASAVEDCSMEFSVTTLKRRVFGAPATQGKADALYGLRGVYRGVFNAIAGSCLLDAADPVAKLLTGQVACCDTITHDGGNQFAEGPIIIGGTGLNARSGVQFDGENSIGAVVVARVLSANCKAGFEICGM